MRWYDYLMCVFYADLITAGLFSGSIVLLTLGGLGYIIYEDARKDLET